jgi:pyruvate-formate lyase-activating enzyme
MSESEYPIKQVALEIYGGCNYKCQMCPQAEGRHHDFLKKIPPEVFSKVVKEAGEHGCEMVSLHGSGEATLHPQMAEYVKLVKDHGMQCITVTNGFRLNERLSRDLITAGLDIIRVSAIGYDRETYLEWMKKDAFELVRENVIKYREIAEQEGGKAKIKLYSLILDPNELEKEVEMYKKNWVEYCGVEAEIWTMHNWSGVYTDTPYERSAKTRRSCGRPNAPYLNVRAGGLNGQTAAVVPCCFVLGQDEKAVLGHLDTQSIDEVLGGEAYETLRKAHAEERFDDIDYCANCDQLYDLPEALVWTNIPGKAYGQSKVLQDLDYRQWNN